MGQRPLPMQPIPPDATPEQRQAIIDDYRAYLVRGAARSLAVAWQLVAIFVVFFAIGLALAFVAARP